MDFISNTNKQISEHVRWARGYMAARQSGGDISQYVPQAAQPQNPLAALFGNQSGMNPLFMMMYYQMMMSMMPTLSNTGGMNGMTGAGQYGASGFPPYYLNIPDAVLQQFFAGQQAPANPASAFLAEQFKNDKTQPGPDGKIQHFTDAELTSIKTEMGKGTFSVNQLGEALMKYIHRVPSQYVDEFTGLLSRLVKDNQINPAPFVNDQYLAQLPPERQVSLSAALARDGLRYQDGSPNSYFLGHLLQHVNGNPDSETRPFVRDLLSRVYTRHKDNLGNPEGKILTGFFTLADIEIKNGLLEFPDLL